MKRKDDILSTFSSIDDCFKEGIYTAPLFYKIKIEANPNEEYFFPLAIDVLHKENQQNNNFFRNKAEKKRNFLNRVRGSIAEYQVKNFGECSIFDRQVRDYDIEKDKQPIINIETYYIQEQPKDEQIKDKPEGDMQEIFFKEEPLPVDMDSLISPETPPMAVLPPIGSVKSINKPVDITKMSDEQLMQHINYKFESLSLLSKAASEFKIRSMIVSGSAGMGKTYEVIQAMRRKKKENPNFIYNRVKGTISTISLYIDFYNTRDGVIILDDTDAVFEDEESMQILKAATESDPERIVSYRKQSKALVDCGIPTDFIFNGCVVILTNKNLMEGGKTKLPHYEAIRSRSHFINATLKTDREKIMRIRHIMATTRMLHNFLDEEHHHEIIEFIEKYHSHFLELSLRTVVKLAELRAAFPDKWQILAFGTLT